jgi:hypothetical protein
MSNTRGGPEETWAMARAKRARKAETLKQPSLCLRLRAPYFYPTPYIPISLSLKSLLVPGPSNPLVNLQHHETRQQTRHNHPPPLHGEFGGPE